MGDCSCWWLRVGDNFHCGRLRLADEQQPGGAGHGDAAVHGDQDPTPGHRGPANPRRAPTPPLPA